MVELQLSHDSKDDLWGVPAFQLGERAQREQSGLPLSPQVLMQPEVATTNMSLQETPHHLLHHRVLTILDRLHASQGVRDEEMGTLSRRFQQKGSELNKTTHIGLVIFAQGRTGTSSLSETIRKSIGMHYCYGEKESFEKINISSTTLTHCGVTHNPKEGGWLAHVKPWHVRRNYPFRTNDPQQFTPMAFSTFFRTARATGFNMILSMFRFNQLERYISAFELAVSHDPDLRRTAHTRKDGEIPVMQTGKWKSLSRRRFVDFDLAAAFLRDAHEFINGTQAALQAGFPVAFMDMGQYVGKMLCPAVKSVFQQMRTISSGMASATHQQVPECFTKKFKCKTRILQMGSSHPHWNLDARVGVEAATAVRKQLEGTEFEWMLNLGAFERPELAMRASFQIPPPGVILMHPHL